MAGKTTRKNKGPIGRKQHRTLRNKRQMRGGMFWSSKSGQNLEDRLDTVEDGLKHLTYYSRNGDKMFQCITKMLGITEDNIQFISNDRVYTTIPTQIETLKTDIEELKKNIEKLNTNFDNLNNQE